MIEILLMGFMAGGIVASIIFGYIHINRMDEVIVPIEFLRTKVFQAKICLTCDNIYHNTEQWCPVCLEKESFSLRNVFPALTPLRIQKEDKDGKVNYTLQMVSEKKSDTSSNHKLDAGNFAKYFDPSINFTPASQPSRFAPDYCPEPPKSKVSKSGHTSGVGMESKCSFIERCHRAYAGNAFIGTALRRVFERGFILSREKH